MNPSRRKVGEYLGNLGFGQFRVRDHGDLARIEVAKGRNGSKPCPYRGGFIENARVRRIQVDISKASVILFETNYQGYRGAKSPTTYSDFVIKDINAGEASAYMLFAVGLDELPIRDVLLRNVIVKYSREPLFLRNVDGLRLDSVRVNGTTLPEFPPMTPPDAPRLKISI